MKSGTILLVNQSPCLSSDVSLIAPLRLSRRQVCLNVMINKYHLFLQIYTYEYLCYQAIKKQHKKNMFLI